MDDSVNPGDHSGQSDSSVRPGGRLRRRRFGKTSPAEKARILDSAKFPLHQINRFVPIIAMLLAGLLGAGYVYDDVEAILENPDLRDGSKWGAILTTNYWGPDRNIGLYRPMVQWSYLAEGMWHQWTMPVVSHLISLLLHCVTVFLFWRWLRRVLKSEILAYWSCWLFAVHPALVEAYFWISGRTDVLAAIFMLCGLLAVRRADDRNEGGLGRYTVLAGLAYLAGLLSKEMAVTLPAIMLCVPGFQWRRRLPLLITALGAYLILRGMAVDGFLPSGTGGVGVALQDRNLIERVLIASRALLRLLAFIPWPGALAADHRAHPYASPDAPVDWSAVACSLVFVVQIVATIRVWRRRPEWAIFSAALLLSLLPIFQIIPIGAVMAERFLYVPSLFCIPLLFLGAARLMKAWPEFPLAALIVVALMFGTTFRMIMRVPVYEDRKSFCEDILKTYPHDTHALNNLGVRYFMPLEGLEPPERDFSRALRAFDKALSIDPEYRRAALNWARASLEWHLAEEDDFRRQEEVVAQIPSRLQHWWVNLRDPDALYLVGKARLRMGTTDGWDHDPELEWQGVLQEQEQAQERKGRPKRLDFSSDKERVQWQKGQLRLAVEAYRVAAKNFMASKRVRPDRAAAALKEAGIAARALGERELMKTFWREALELNPNLRDAGAMRRAIK